MIKGKNGIIQVGHREARIVPLYYIDITISLICCPQGELGKLHSRKSPTILQEVK